ncbi:MAG: YkgJ family cysteine cluster protein [Alphaproteobacteria bacterium]|nr:YkgJ family cysteine cluster protein [Alphaproteobacteria bacterium]
MDRHFDCTACGKCCHGWLPLTLGDALTHAGRFPLAVVWTPVKRTSRDHGIATRLGFVPKLRDRGRLAVRIVPTVYVPPSFPCPALRPDALCALHADKPSRCRTMPFYPYREEADQAEHLVPRAGWACDVSPGARPVYRDRKILDREDFDRERAALLDQVPLLRAYGEWMMKMVPGMEDNLLQAARKPGGGHVVVGFGSLLRRLADVDKAGIASAQHGLLADLAARTADQPALAEYHRQYDNWAWEMDRLRS